MAVTGLSLVLGNIANCFDQKLVEATNVAAGFAKVAVQRFQQHQFSADHEPLRKAKADTSAMKSKAREFAASNQGGPPITAMGEPWTNRTFRAARTVFADHGYNESEKYVYFNLYHTMSYGVYLELGRNRRFAVLEPIVRGLAPEFLQRIKEIYAGK